MKIRLDYMDRVVLSDMQLPMVSLTRHSISFNTLYFNQYVYSALRGKKDPPKIDPEHIKVLEHLGSVRYRFCPTIFVASGIKMFYI